MKGKGVEFPIPKKEKDLNTLKRSTCEILNEKNFKVESKSLNKYDSFHHS